MVNLYSDDTYTKKSGGRIPKYRADMYGPEFDAAVNALTEQNALSGVVKSTRGFHIAHLLAKKATTLDSVKEDLRKLLVAEKPSAKERYDYIEVLRKAATIVK
jgi:parvulin-like peptidyl-prolyl isomerase